MSVPYDAFSGAFLAKVTEYDFINMMDRDRNDVVDGYMKRAISEFNKICKYDLSTGNDELREFDIDIADGDIDEILNIVSEGMVVQWMRQYLYRADNLENILNTPDFYAYSPAELTYRITNAYQTSRKNFIQYMREYSYNHGDLTTLHT